MQAASFSENGLTRARPLQLTPALTYFPSMHVFKVETMMAPHMAGRGDEEGPGGPGLGVATRTRTRTKKPTPYKVLMLNDDYTPMEFVVDVLQRFFRMDIEQATRVMLHVHQKGVGVCGVFSYEVAETKVNQVMDFARQNQHPLQCTLETA
jgi:ATP-dependent Clp protease adaptor protein ClpS